MKLFILPTLLAFIVLASCGNSTAAPDSIEATTVSTAATTSLPEPILERVVTGDSVAIWVDELADLRHVRPYRSGEELLPEADSTLLASREKPLSISWKLLTNIEYVLTFNKKIDMEVYAPIFPDTLKNLAGKLVSVKGYVIPFDDSQQTVALSANPYASCFFCGKASPASVLTLRFAKPGKNYKLDARKTFKGILRLNYDDPDEFYYVLDEAEVL